MQSRACTGRRRHRDGAPAGKKHIPHWSKGILSVTGVRLSVEGLDNIPKDGPCVFVANHRSYYDIPLLLAGLDEPYGILAKEELGKFLCSTAG